MPPNTARIAKNTLMLYFRQILLMLVSLYTVRVVLNTLGVEDYGIYNVVAGVVTMFGFLSNTMAAASQRYFSFAIGRGNSERLQQIFSLSLIIFALIVIMVLIIAETIGLWFVINKLTIAPERKEAALWVYQCSIVSFLFTILPAPYMAMIIANEDMNIYAYVSIVEAVLKLAVGFVLGYFAWDKLKLYGILMCGVPVINTAIYHIICVIKYRECKFRFYWDRALFKEIAGFVGWSMFGNLSGMFRGNAVTILLNQYFNPIIVVARNISMQINAAVISISNNFNIALEPQIVKHFSAGEKEQMYRLISRSAKTAYFLMFILAVPVMVEMQFLLSLWLTIVPPYTVVFARLVIIESLVSSLCFPIGSAAHASGEMRLYQGVLGIMHLVFFMITWLLLRLGLPAVSVFYVSIGAASVVSIIRLLIVRYLISYPLRMFFHEVIIPVFLVTLCSSVLPAMVYFILRESIFRFFITLITGVVIPCFFIYNFGLNEMERCRIREIIFNRLNILGTKKLGKRRSGNENI
jgi:O-antigen/teichoic acid export membrane protein